MDFKTLIYSFSIQLLVLSFCAGQASFAEVTKVTEASSVPSIPVPTLQDQPGKIESTPKKNIKQVVFISLAPSPYTHRHDSMRAGFGIFLLLQHHVKQYKLPISLKYYDGSLFYENKSKIAQVLSLADVYVLGGSTWNQGPAYYVRRFFEIGGMNNLLGVSATAWATAGGAETGGGEVVHSFLRSMMGLGANVFTLGQKYMVFTTDERLEPATPGAFSQFDMWYMDQFARMIAVQTIAGSNRVRALELAKRLGTTPFYFKSTHAHEFPPPQNILDQYNDLLVFINKAADPGSDAWKVLQSLLSTPGRKIWSNQQFRN